MAYAETKTDDYELFRELKRTGNPIIREELINKPTTIVIKLIISSKITIF